MRAAALISAFLITAVLLLARSPGDASGNPVPSRPLHLPWKEAGLTEQQAAAHLLNRFAYGPRPGDVEAVVKMGLDRWFEQQLAAALPDPRLEERLDRLPAWEMPESEILNTYPPVGKVLAEAKRDGALPETMEPQDLGKDGKKEARDEVMRYAREQGYRSQKELLGQLMAQKLWRALESENQLAEVMTDFWFNHFNVSLTDNQSRAYLLSYERDAIRPYALGTVRDLLEATARHPAMLLYLDNAQSSAAPGAVTTLDEAMERRPGMRRLAERRERAPEQTKRRRPQGLNENYARELMELHTLGVDGGYTQQDVIEVARAFTGWSVLPAGPFRRDAEQRLERVRRAGGLGFESEGEFLFRADQHDAGAKVVLGRKLPAGRGVEDGEEVLDLLAAYPATARHLATKLAARFVSDQPPKPLVDRLTAVYLRSGGDVREMLRALAESPEFWAAEARGAKIKSPFELAASAIRAVGGRVEDPRATLRWIAEMGQPLYACQAPTGYPDRAESWVNAGALLQRMNFGLQLAARKIPGVRMDLSSLNALSGNREPASRDDALRAYATLLMPGRDVTQALAALVPVANDPGLDKKVAATPVEQAVGVILGSPEFQRR